MLHRLGYKKLTVKLKGAPKYFSVLKTQEFTVARESTPDSTILRAEHRNQTSSTSWSVSILGLNWNPIYQHFLELNF